MSGFIKYFDNGGKSMSLFMVKGDSVLVKYSEIQNKNKELTDKRLHSKPIYDDKYINTKVKTFNDVVHKNIPKENTNDIFLAIITLKSVMRMDKKLSSSIFRRMQIRCKREKDDQLHRH